MNWKRASRAGVKWARGERQRGGWSDGQEMLSQGGFDLCLKREIPTSSISKYFQDSSSIFKLRKMVTGHFYFLSVLLPQTIISMPVKEGRYSQVNGLQAPTICWFQVRLPHCQRLVWSLMLVFKEKCRIFFITYHCLLKPKLVGSKKSRNRITKVRCFQFLHKENEKRERERERPIHDVWCQKKPISYDWNMTESHCLSRQCQITTVYQGYPVLFNSEEP